MSISHPFLKQLKFYVRELCSLDMEVTDLQPCLLSFCKTLEDILCSGLRINRYDRVSYRYWKWFEALLTSYSVQQLTSPIKFGIEYVQSCQKTITDVGRGRLAIRFCLNRRVLSKCIGLLRENNSLLYMFYDNVSIIGDAILSEMLLSLLAILESKVVFSLNLRVQSFLDETWQLPTLRRYELVPSNQIGVNILNVNKRLVVVEVDSGSVADEDLKIEPGDIIDDLFGESLRASSVKKAIQLLSDYRGTPIYISVIKCLYGNEEFYRPILPYLEASKLNRDEIRAWRRQRLKEIASSTKQLNLAAFLDEEGQCSHPLTVSTVAADQQTISEHSPQISPPLDDNCFRANVLGYINVGDVGTVDKIESSVTKVIRECPEKEKREIDVILTETRLSVRCARDPSRILFQHSYPEIASCGRRIDYPLNFSYIAGEVSCNLANKFNCYVFEARSSEEAKTILNRIADGFERTHWAV